LGCRCLPSVNTICGRIMVGLSLLSSSVNTLCGRIMIGLSLLSSSVNTICGRIMIGLSLLSSVSKHNMWSCYDWVVVVVFRLLTQHVVIL
jgi:hypothetical protein